MLCTVFPYSYYINQSSAECVLFLELLKLGCFYCGFVFYCGFGDFYCQCLCFLNIITEPMKSIQSYSAWNDRLVKLREFYLLNENGAKIKQTIPFLAHFQLKLDAISQNMPNYRKQVKTNRQILKKEINHKLYPKCLPFLGTSPTASVPSSSS